MPRRKKTPPPSFEEALEELESMVESMESGQLPLEKLIANYEKGAQLIAHCETVLNDARKRLELITLKPTASTNHSDSTSSAESQSHSHGDTSSSNESTYDGDNDEIRLF